MRLEVHVDIGGDALAGGEAGQDELARLLRAAALAVDANLLVIAGQSVTLRDLNGNTVGFVRLVPDWKEGDEVFVTNLNGSIVPSVIRRVEPHHTREGFVWVVCAPTWSGQPMDPVIVDQWGLGVDGQPHLGRRR